MNLLMKCKLIVKEKKNVTVPLKMLGDGWKWLKMADDHDHDNDDDESNGMA